MASARRYNRAVQKHYCHLTLKNITVGSQFNMRRYVNLIDAITNAITDSCGTLVIVEC